MRAMIVCICLLLTLGCVPKKEIKQAGDATHSGNWGRAYELWADILEKDPSNTKARLEFERARLNAGLGHLNKASRYYYAKKYNEAAFELNLVLGYDPDNQEGQRLLGNVVARLEEIKAIKLGKEAKKKEPASKLPRLRPTTWAPQNLNFVNKEIGDIYRSMGQAYGINIVLDPKLRKGKTTVNLRNLNFLKALDTLMIVNRHFFKVIDDNTIIILEDNKSNRGPYENQIIRTFYLSNIEPKELKQHISRLGGIKDYAENTKLNAVTIKGTPEEVALAEKIIRDNDKAQAEVVIEVEMLEVNKNLMRRVGIIPVDASGSPQFRAGIIADPANRSSSDENNGGLRGIFPSLNESDFLTLVPALAIDFLKDKGDSKQVANPQLRVTSGEEGLIRIGQSIPIVNTSFTTPNISGSSSGNSNQFGEQALTSFDYKEVGIKISIVPRVHYNNEVTLVLNLEVSSVLSGGLTPILGQRQVTTTLRLKNGEINVIAGLLSEDERRSLVGIPGLMDIPIIGKLFTNDEKVVTKTDIIMTVRPIIVRGPNITDEDRAPYGVSSLSLSTLYGDQELDSKWEQVTPPPVDVGEAEDVDQNAQAPDEEESEEPASVEEENPAGDDLDGEELDPEATGPLPAMLAFSPPSQTVQQDDMVEYSLFITNVEGLNRGEITVTFDPKVLQAEAVGIGDFFNSGGRKPHLTPAWNNDTGTVTLIVTQRRGADPFSGSGIMATLRFRAKAPGSGALDFRNLILKNIEKQDIPTEGLSGSYEVSL